jgi:hypothetical protein
MNIYKFLSILACLTSTSVSFPQFAGIGPWEGGFFGPDSGPNRFGPQPYPAYPPQAPYGNGYNAYGDKASPYPPPPPPPPPGADYFGLQPEAVIEAPPLEPIDLMNAPKEKLPKRPNPPPLKSVSAEAGESTEACEPEEKSDNEESAGDGYDFIGSRWGTAGQGKYIEAAKGDHRLGKERNRLIEYWNAPTERKTIKKDGKAKEKEEEKPKQEMPEVTVTQDPEDPISYKVHIGGLRSQTGEDGTAPPTSYHVFSDENSKEIKSDSMSPEAEKYIMEKMVPKLGGRRKVSRCGIN